MVGNIPPELMNNCENFGDVLQEIREDKQYNQRYVGRRLHVSKSTIDRWENNELPHYFTLQDVINIATVLGCTTEELARLTHAFLCYVLDSRGFGEF